MKDKILKAADIAGLTGITEEEVKRISKEFSKAIPSREIGRVRVYEKKAAGIISKISGLSQKGLSDDEIATEVGCQVRKKSTKDKISEKIRQKPASADKKISHPEIKVTDTVEKATNAVIKKANAVRNFDSDRYATLELRLSKVTKRLEILEEEVADNRKESERNIEDLREMILTLDKKISVSSEWTDYFEKSLDEYRASQNKINDNFHKWIDYIDAETEYLKQPWWKRNKKTEVK